MRFNIGQRLVLVLVLAVCVAAGSAVLRRGRDAGAAAVGLEPDRVMVALATLKTPDGLLASPPVLGPGSLPATGWTAAIASRVGTSMPSVDRRDLTQVAASSASVPNGVWNVYFSVQALTSSGATVTAADTKPLVGWETPGGWIEQKDPGAPLDLPATVLSTWAAVRSMDAADQPVADRTVAAARTTLANCQGNTFVQVHLVEILTTARPQTSRSALQALARCRVARSTLDGARGVQNEVDLLTAFAEAKRSSLLGTADNLTTPERLTQLRQMLRPQPFMRYDPWWAFYALDGYVAAGGDAHQFDEVAEGLIELVDDRGIADQVGSPVVSAQGMFYAVRVVQAIGRDPHGLIDTDALLRFGQQAEPGTWADADVALWGDTLYMLGADLSEGLAEKIRAAARRCAEPHVTPPVARQVGLCRDALLHFGGVPGPLRYADTDWSSQPAEILVDVTSSTGSPPDKRAVERAVRDLAEVPESLATTELAALPSVARLVDAPLSKEEEHALTDELRHRHGREPLSALFTVRDDGSFPDFASTSAVARMYVATQ